MEYMLSATRKQEFVAEFRQRLEKTKDLPTLPDVARKLIRLKNSPDASIHELTEIIEQDPSISMQIVRYARMSSFGYGERIKTIEDAVQLVLGFNRALHMALGISAGKSLNMPSDGPLGYVKLWEHALHVAILAQSLAKELPEDKPADPGISYLAGLVHDIGFMLLGHLYPNEFTVLSKLLERCNSRDLRELEFQCLGISHDMVGLYLLRSWDMPSEVAVAVGEHHFPDYGGEHAIYAKLVYLANYLLTLEGLEYINCNASDNRLDIEQLGLGDEQIERALLSVRNMSPELCVLAKELAA